MKVRRLVICLFCLICCLCTVGRIGAQAPADCNRNNLKLWSAKFPSESVDKFIDCLEFFQDDYDKLISEKTVQQPKVNGNAKNKSGPANGKTSGKPDSLGSKVSPKSVKATKQIEEDRQLLINAYQAIKNYYIDENKVKEFQKYEPILKKLQSQEASSQ